MAEGDQPPTKRVRLSQDEVERMTKEELSQRFLEQENYIDTLLSRQGNEANSLELEEKIKQMQQESVRRENVLVMRLTAKEQELQEVVSQNEEMKRAQNPSTAQLRGMLLDPAINLMFQRMKKEMEQSKEKLEQALNDLAAWKFTPDGQTGKRLMAKCRMLLQENSELGRVISSGRTAKLEGEIALGKKFVEEMKQSQSETEEFLVQMDEDVEGLQSTVYLLQQQLKEAKEQIQELQEQLGGSRTSSSNSNKDNAAGLELRTSGDDEGQFHRHTSNGNSNHQTTTDMDTDSSEHINKTSHDKHKNYEQSMDSNVVSDNNTQRTAKFETLHNGMIESQGSM